MFAKLGITYLSNAYIMQVLGMFLYALCACIIFKTVGDRIGNSNQKVVDEVLVDICILLMFINPYITETYVYGSMVWAAGILLGCLCAYCWCNKKHIIGFVLALLTVSYYQADIFIPLIICIISFWLEAMKTSDYIAFMKRSAVTSIYFAMTCAISLLISKISMRVFMTTSVAKNVTTEELSSFGLNIYAVIRGIGIFLFTTSGFSPLLFSFVVIIACFAAGAVSIMLNGRNIMSGIVAWGLFCSVLVFIPFSFGLVGASGGYAPRIILACFFSLGGIIISTYFLLQRSFEEINKVVISIVRLSIIMIVAVYYVYNTIGITDCFIQQALDTREVHLVQGAIENYEASSNNTITTILTLSDKNPLYIYPEQINHYYGTTYNHRMLRDAWSQGQYLNYMCGTNYKTKNFSEEKYTELFGESNWDELSLDEQLYFEGDTLYWAVY